MGTGILDQRLADAGLSRREDGLLVLGGVPLSEIAEETGTPAYVYDTNAIRQRYAQLDEAMTGLPHRICYAVKANSNLAVLRTLVRLGAGADIVSGGELLRALAAGFAPDQIVFSGAGKTDDELLAAITAGVGLINIESIAELRQVALLSELSRVELTIGIRINPDVTAETHPYITTGKGGLKFGVPIDQFPEALAILEDAPRLDLGALAIHLGSQLLDPAPFVAGLSHLVRLLAKARSAGHSPTILDLGGGFGIRYRHETPPEASAWVAPLREALAESGCTVQIEPGRFLVGNAGILLTRVVHRKHSGGREIAIVDAGMNDLLRPSLYQAWHDIVPVEAVVGDPIPMDVVGPVCESGDFIALERELAPVSAGQLLAILGAGAYGFVMSSNYNSRARAPEVIVDQGRWAVARPRERLADLFRDEIADPFASETS